MNNNTRKQTKQSRRQASGNRTSAVSRVTPWATGGSASEVKYFTKQVNNAQLFHNSALLLDNQNLLEGPASGVGVDQRLGSKIYVRSLSAVMVLNNKSDRPNVSYRVVVVASPNNGNTDSYAECFAAGFTGLHFPSNSQLLHDAIFPGNQGASMETSLKERSHIHRFDIPIGRAVTYDRLNGLVCNTRLAVYVIPYDAFATLQTDNIASVAMASYRIEFVDA